MSCSVSPPASNKRRAPSPPPSPKRRCLSVAHLVHHDPPAPSCLRFPHPTNNHHHHHQPYPQPPHQPQTHPHPHAHVQAQAQAHAHAHAHAQAQVVDKFTKSRAVGQSHRDNERGHIQSLTDAVAQGRTENALLYTLVQSAHQRQLDALDTATTPTPTPTGTPSPSPSPHHKPKAHPAQPPANESSSTTTTDGDDADGNASDNHSAHNAGTHHWPSTDAAPASSMDEDECNQVRSHVPWDNAEDCDIIDDDTAERLGLYKLSDDAARLFGQAYISAEFAVVLLEYLLLRRNLITTQPDPTDSCRPRRRRTSYRAATTDHQANTVMQYALRVFAGGADDLDDEDVDGAMHVQDVNDIRRSNTKRTKRHGHSSSSKQKRRWRRMDRKLGAFGRLMAYYDRVEWTCDPPSIFDDGMDELPVAPHAHVIHDFDDDFDDDDVNLNHAFMQQSHHPHGHERHQRQGVAPPRMRLDLSHSPSHSAQLNAQMINSTSPPPRSPTRPDAAEFGSPVTSSGGAPPVQVQPQHRRRGEGAKRCSRCHKLKISGSGHGRSKCDDGYSISSLVPYPAPQRPDDMTAAGRTAASGAARYRGGR